MSTSSCLAHLHPISYCGRLFSGTICMISHLGFEWDFQNMDTVPNGCDILHHSLQQDNIVLLVFELFAKSEKWYIHKPTHHFSIMCS